MTAAQRAKFKKRLVALEREMTGKGSKKLPNRAEEVEPTNDEDEAPLNEMIQSIDSNRNRNLTGVLARIQKALAKLEQTPDEFGLCEECGEEIGAGRLTAMPYAERCVTCQGQRDGPKGMPTRRKLTDYQ